MNQARTLRCKVYHQSHGVSDEGALRPIEQTIRHDQSRPNRSTRITKKSRCPGWVADPVLRQRLLDEALVDPNAGVDPMGYPKRLWNAINGWYFVAVSTNEAQPSYNCYPEHPTTLLEQLAMRAGRNLEEVLGSS